jgi:alkylhydroperoxidase family enzyme
VDDIPDMESIRMLRPDLAGAFEGFREFASGRVEPRIVELCRLRMAQIQDGLTEPLPQTATTRAAGITDAQLRDLANWRESDQFDEAEKACLTMGEYFCYTSQAITDEQVAEVSKHLSAEQVLVLTTSFWATDASGRLANFLSSLEVSP